MVEYVFSIFTTSIADMSLFQIFTLAVGFNLIVKGSQMIYRFIADVLGGKV